MWELDCEESWGQKNWCFWTVVLEKTLESPLDCKEIQPVHSFGRTNAKAETPILWPPHAKSWLIGKDSCWEGLGAGGEGDDRGWDGWMASLTQWTWVWVNSGGWWWTGRPDVLRFMRSQSWTRLSDWTELNWTEYLVLPTQELPMGCMYSKSLWGWKRNQAQCSLKISCRTIGQDKI